MQFVYSLLFAISVLSAPAVAVAQTPPGSVGGTIGKHDKSISGENEQPKTRSSAIHPRPRAVSPFTAAHHGSRPAAAAPPDKDCRLVQGSAQFGAELCF